MSKNYVSRDKYDILKDKAIKWQEKAEDYKLRYEKILEENNNLLEENDNLQETVLKCSDIDNTDYEKIEIENIEFQNLIREQEEQIQELNNKIYDIQEKNSIYSQKLKAIKKQKYEEQMFDKFLIKIKEHQQGK